MHYVGQRFDCEWLVSMCLNDYSCKQLHDDWKTKCKSVIEWNVKVRFPVCTDECKQANKKLLKHKIWKRSADCDCGRLDDNVSLQGIRKTERCLRQKVNMGIFCDLQLLIRCPPGKEVNYYTSFKLNTQILVNQRCAVLQEKCVSTPSPVKHYLKDGRDTV